MAHAHLRQRQNAHVRLQREATARLAQVNPDRKEREIERARAAGVAVPDDAKFGLRERMLLIQEKRPGFGGCSFHQIIGATPEDLRKRPGSILDPIAVEMNVKDNQRISLRLNLSVLIKALPARGRWAAWRGAPSFRKRRPSTSVSLRESAAAMNAFPTVMTAVVGGMAAASRAGKAAAALSPDERGAEPSTEVPLECLDDARVVKSGATQIKALEVDSTDVRALFASQEAAIATLLMQVAKNQAENKALLANLLAVLQSPLVSVHTGPVPSQQNTSPAANTRHTAEARTKATLEAAVAASETAGATAEAAEAATSEALAAVVDEEEVAKVESGVREITEDALAEAVQAAQSNGDALFRSGNGRAVGADGCDGSQGAGQGHRRGEGGG